MFTFSTLSFISYTIFVSVFSIIIFKTLCYIIDDIRSNKIQKNEKVKPPLKIGGIYGKKRKLIDQNNPFSSISLYAFYVAIIDVKPSRNGNCYYCQYVYLHDNMSPYSGYSKHILYSNQTNYFDDWEYVKDIDLNTIKIS